MIDIIWRSWLVLRPPSLEPESPSKTSLRLYCYFETKIMPLCQTGCVPLQSGLHFLNSNERRETFHSSRNFWKAPFRWLSGWVREGARFKCHVLKENPVVCFNPLWVLWLSKLLCVGRKFGVWFNKEWKSLKTRSVQGLKFTPRVKYWTSNVWFLC